MYAFNDLYGNKRDELCNADKMTVGQKQRKKLQKIAEINKIERKYDICIVRLGLHKKFVLYKRTKIIFCAYNC